jgi:uncharacterized membrane protein
MREDTPLSQAPAKKKLAIAIPGTVLGAAAWRWGDSNEITRFVTLALAAYAVIGIIELLAGESLTIAAKRWDSIAAWKKVLITLAVIVLAFFSFITLMMLVAKWVN